MKAVDPRNPQVLLLIRGLQEISYDIAGTVIIYEENDRLQAALFYGIGDPYGTDACTARRDAASFAIQCEREGKLRIHVRPGSAEIIVPHGGL